MDETFEPRRGLTRRELMRRAAAGGTLIALPGGLAACLGEGEGGATGAAEPTPTGVVTMSDAATETTQAAAKPVRGGRLRVGVVAAGPGETLDPHAVNTQGDFARAVAHFDTLTNGNIDGEVVPWLAEEIEPNTDASEWQLRLRDGVEFHDGKTLTAEDVLYSLQRIVDPKNATAAGARSYIAPIVDVKAAKRVDDRTLILPMLRPFNALPNMLAIKSINIVPAGATQFRKPIGTGPFKSTSFKPGENSLSVRNENYWTSGQPYLDELEIIGFKDENAMLNALLGGQLDAISSIPRGQARKRADNKDLVVIRAPSNNAHTFTMRLDQKPFDDPRVRLAVKHAVDRQAMVDRLLLGYGRVGNDYFGSETLVYDDMPQRVYDPERARSLLAEAGYRDGLDITDFEVGGGFPGTQMSELFRASAKEAGIRVKIQVVEVSKFYAEYYAQPKASFSSSFWGGPLFSSIQLGFNSCCSKAAPYNETAWVKPEWEAKISEALSTTDTGRRDEILHDVNRTMYEEGGYVFHSYADLLYAQSPRVRKDIPDLPTLPLAGYEFRSFWLE